MRNYLIFDNGDSRNYGVYINGQGTFNAPARAYELIDIPGRNGALIGNEKRLENIEVTYPAFIYTNFREQIQNWRNFLLSRVGYKKLIDSYNPDEYRMAAYAGAFEVEATRKNNAGQFEIVFNCKPQRFLTSGDIVTTLTANGHLTNPTRFPAKPLLRVYGAGTVSVGSTSITITDPPYSYTDIDCEMQDAYYGATNLNKYIRLTGQRFPELASGSNYITMQSGVTRVDITPRWWRV